ncbi:MAG: hypothetical protein GY918_02400 [Gammaproteobacteria bacterium]|nr:hypothetical protein [Gammaproteobacteria bacterium]
MKTLLNTLLIAGLLGTASTAMANSATVAGHAYWNGNTGSMQDMCKFNGTPTAGVMSFDEATKTWKTTSAAVVIVQTRGNNNLKVEPVNTLYQGSTPVTAITVKYNAAGATSTVTMPTGAGAANVNTSTIDASMNNVDGEVTFNIAGTATHTTDVMLSENEDYTVKHKITCTQ